MNIWVDADACPVVIKEILFRAAMRTQIETIFVANAPIRVPNSTSNLGSTLLRSDTDGAVRIRFTKDGIQVEKQREAGRRYWQGR